MLINKNMKNLRFGELKFLAGIRDLKFYYNFVNFVILWENLVNSSQFQDIPGMLVEIFRFYS